MPIAFILGIIGIGLLLLYLAFNLEKIHVFLKLLIVMTVVFMQLITGKFFIQFAAGTAFEQASLDFFRAYMWFIRIFVIYVFVYTIYTVMDYLGRIPSKYSLKSK